MKINDYQAKYFAYELTKRCSSDSLEKLSTTLSNAQVDLNPHQIEAALFAFKSPLSKGAILADEVGLGKTIEAGLVLSQKWAEKKRRILLIVPSSLRKQWNQELLDKFFLPSIILETKSFNQIIKSGNLNPLIQDNNIIICSYHFARAKAPYIKQAGLDLVIIDEAHRLRNVYKTGNKIARDIKDAIQEYPKILLTATPLQNSLLELYGLVSIIDSHVFGDLNSFKANYARVPREQDTFVEDASDLEPRNEMFADLRNRLKPVCIRTLRRQVLEYIDFKDRKAITQDYIPTEQEIELYNGMTEYLQRPVLYALPSSQRQLMTLILRKLLASSSFAIASTLKGLIYKLDKLEEEIVSAEAKEEYSLFTDISENFESFDETADEWIDDEEDELDEQTKKSSKLTAEDLPKIQAEKEDLKKFRSLAKGIFQNSKGDSLLIALKKGFEMTEELNAQKKAVIFTESRITQKYLLDLLSENGYKDKIMLFNGTNNDDQSKEIYKNWLEANKESDKVTGSKTADSRAALVDYFKSDAEIMIATEAAAEGINLQFCSLVINYDLPWNPQRIEQRIGRCHRYGQKHDVVVVNFVNRKNAADQRVYELLDVKFKLFTGVFGASDEILGSIESGVDFEKRIAAIYQSCRTEEEINTAFDTLRNEMDEPIQEGMMGAKEKLLENFDAEVHEKLRLNLSESRIFLDRYEKWLWDITQYYLKDSAIYKDDEYSFVLKENPFKEQKIENGPYKIGKNIDDAHIYRPAHPLAQSILSRVKDIELSECELVFDYTNNGTIITPLKELVGKSGVLRVSELTIESFESEDRVVVTAIDSDGNVIEEESAKRLFSIPSKPNNIMGTIDHKYADEKEKGRIGILTSSIAEKNSEFFDEEVDKLDKWADDVKKSLEIELKRLDIDIKTMKTNAKKVLNLEEKVLLQREIKDLEKKRNEMRHKLYKAQDEVDDRKEGLLERVESQLNQKTSLKTLFTVKWKVI